MEINLIQPQKNRIKPWMVILGIFGFLILSLAVAISFSVKDQLQALKDKQNAALSSLNQVKGAEGDGSNAWLGAKTPKVTLVEFADFGCSYSKKEEPVIRNFLLKHFKDVKLIFRDYPIITEQSLDLAMSARCMSEQGLFWETHNYLYDNQGNVKTQAEIILAIKKLGGNSTKFATCMEAQKYLKQIKKDAQAAENFGFTGTPAFIMNGYVLPQGDLPAEYLEKLFNELNKNNLK